MRHDKIIPGAILITLGAIFLLQSFGYLHIHWINFLYLWPVFLVIGGINLIFAHNKSPWASGLKAGVVVVGILLILFSGLGNRYNWPHYTYHFNTDKNDDDNDDNGDKIVKVEGSSTFNEPFHPEVKFAKLNISGGGTSYYLNDTTNQLFQAYTKEFNGRYQYSHHTDDSVYVLDFDMKKNQHFFWHSNKSNSVTFKLNTTPVWDMDIQTGATELDFDLSKFKVRNLELNGGAASYRIKLGEPVDVTKIDISTGMAQVNIKVPKDAACRITTDSGLSSNHFEGFTKTDDDVYETPNFNAAAKKIFVKIDGGMSGFNVNRY